MARSNEARFDFWYDDKWYTVQGAETMMKLGTKDDLATMRSEYTRMRDTAQKRLKRLQEKFPQSKAYQYHQYGFKKLKELDPRDFPKAFAELAKFLKAKGSTVSGQKSIKQKTMKTWQEQGLNLNESNYDRVIRLLEEMRKQKVIYGSDKLIEFTESVMDLSDSQVDDMLSRLDTVFGHLDDITDAVDLMKTGDFVSFEEVVEQLGW